MIKKLVIGILTIVLLTTGAALAEAPVPQSATMVFYWMTGSITNYAELPTGQTDKQVVLYGQRYDQDFVSAPVLSDGRYIMNAYEHLYYYPYNMLDRDNPIFFAAVVREFPDDYGTMEVVTFNQWDKGYLEVDFELCQGCGPLSGYGQLGGIVFEALQGDPDHAPIVDAQIRVENEYFRASTLSSHFDELDAAFPV